MLLFITTMDSDHDLETPFLEPLVTQEKSFKPTFVRSRHLIYVHIALATFNVLILVLGFLRQEPSAHAKDIECGKRLGRPCRHAANCSV